MSLVKVTEQVNLQNCLWKILYELVLNCFQTYYSSVVRLDYSFWILKKLKVKFSGQGTQNVFANDTSESVNCFQTSCAKVRV